MALPPLDALPRLPSFSRAPPTHPEPETLEVSQETLNARKQFWNKFKVNKRLGTTVAFSPSAGGSPENRTGPVPPATLTPMLASPVPGSHPMPIPVDTPATATELEYTPSSPMDLDHTPVPDTPPALTRSDTPPAVVLDTPPDAAGHRWESYGMNPPPDTAVVPDPPLNAPAGNSTAVATGEKDSGEKDSGKNTMISEALKRCTTVDLENGAKPGSLAVLRQERPVSTAVLMSIGGTMMPVVVNLPPEECRAAGLQLVSEASSSAPDAIPTDNAEAPETPQTQMVVDADASQTEPGMQVLPAAPPALDASADKQHPPAAPPLDASADKQHPPAAPAPDASANKPLPAVPAFDASSNCQTQPTPANTNQPAVAPAAGNGKKPYNAARARFQRTSTSHLFYTNFQIWGLLMVPFSFLVCDDAQ